MAIRKDKRSGLWRDDIVVGHKMNDAGNVVPIRKSFYGRTRQEVTDKIDDFKLKRHLGIESHNQYFGILADSWIEDFFLKDGSLKDSTKQLYFDAWKRHIRPLPFYNMRLDEVTAKTIQKAYNDLQASGTPASQIRAIHNLMQKFYLYVDQERLGRNVTVSVKIPKIEKGKPNEEIIIWTDDEIRTILQGFDKADPRFRLRFLIFLAYFTGCRKGELLALTYDDITDDGIRINKTLGPVSKVIDGKTVTVLEPTTPKTKSSIRTIPVDPIILRELSIHRAWHLQDQLKNGYRTNNIFTTDSGKYYDKWNVDAALTRYYKAIGVEPKSMHTYRHTFGTNLSKNGTSLETVSTLMGHVSTAVTAKYYVNVSKDSKQNAIRNLRTAIGL